MTMSRYSQKLPSQCCSRKCVLSRRLSTSEINGFVFVGIVDSPDFSDRNLSLNLPVCFVYRKSTLTHLRHAAQTCLSLASGNLGPSIKSDTHLSQGLRHGLTHLMIRSKIC